MCSKQFLAAALVLALTACGSDSTPAGDGGASGADGGQDASTPTENDSGTAPATCGDGVCDATETVDDCPDDCVSDTCGNGVCDAGETATSCPPDCGSGDPCVDRVDCSECGSADECGTCCDEAQPDALNELQLILGQTCGCNPGAICEAQCVDGCSGSALTTECITCINDAIAGRDACLAEAARACTDSPGCAPILSCYGGCPG